MSLMDKLNRKLAKDYTTMDLLITWKDTKEKISIEDYHHLKELGEWIQKSGSFLRLRTTRVPSEVKKIFCEDTGFDEADVTVINAAGLYVPF